jgi:hypothetical protein
MTDIRVKIDELSPYDDVNTDKSRRDLFEVSKNTGTYASPTYATDGSRKISVEQLKETLFIKEINSYKSVTIGSPTFDKQSYNGIGNSGTYTLPTSTGKYEVLAIIIEGSLSVTVTGLGGGYGDLVFTNQNETAYLIDTIYGWYPLSISIDLITQTVTNGVTDKSPSEDAVYDFVTGLGLDKICPNLVTLIASTYTANANENIKADALSIGSDVNITIPTAGIEGRLIYVYYPTGSPSAFVVELIGGFTATLVQGDYFLIRDNGSYWEAISTSQNTAPTPTLDTVTGAGDTTTNSVTVGGLVVDMPSGSGAAASITKGGAGEALTVSKTSGSGNVATITGGKTLISELDLTTPLADSEIASASTWNAKLGGTITNNTLPKGNGAGGLVDSIITENAGVVTIAGGFVSSAITGGTVNANNILRTPVLATDTVTVLNGSLWYNTASNLFKGFVNGIVVTFMTSRMPANTIKANNTGSTADAVDLALTTETVLGRTASVNSGNISPIPLQASISAETTLVAGTRTITDSRVTANTIVLISPSNTGTLTQQIRYTKNVGTSIVFTAGGSDTCTFSYWIIF